VATAIARSAPDQTHPASHTTASSTATIPLATAVRPDPRDRFERHHRLRPRLQLRWWAHRDEANRAQWEETWSTRYDSDGTRL